MGNILNFDIIDVIKIEHHVPNIITTKDQVYCTLSCRISGECTLKTNSTSLIAKKGDVVFIPLSSDYTQFHAEETVIAFRFYIGSPIRSEIQIYSPNDSKIINLFKKAESLWRKKVDNYQYFCQSILYEIIGKTNAIIQNSKPTIPMILKDSILYIDSHMFDTNFTIENCLSEVHVSRTYFNKLFKKYYNCTPISYINLKRISRAKRLIRAGNYNNKAIAELCGFKETEYYYHMFKSITGITPKEFKKESFKNSESLTKN